MRIQLNADEFERIMRPVHGQGGFQNLLRDMQNGTDPNTRVLEISDANLERVVRYFFQYGEGGFQGRMEPTARRRQDGDAGGA